MRDDQLHGTKPSNQVAEDAMVATIKRQADTIKSLTADNARLVEERSSALNAYSVQCFATMQVSQAAGASVTALEAEIARMRDAATSLAEQAAHVTLGYAAKTNISGALGGLMDKASTVIDILEKVPSRGGSDDSPSHTPHPHMALFTPRPAVPHVEQRRSDRSTKGADTMTREQIIEAMARGSLIHEGIDPDQKYRWSDWGADTEPHELHWHGVQPEMRAILSAMEAAIPGLSDVIKGKAVVVPRRPDDTMTITDEMVDLFMTQMGMDEEDRNNPFFTKLYRSALSAVAPMIRADERERCAKVAEDSRGSGFPMYERGWAGASRNIAAAIRAMGEPT